MPGIEAKKKHVKVLSGKEFGTETTRRRRFTIKKSVSIAMIALFALAQVIIPGMILVQPAQAAGATYYVAKTGSDSSSGSASSPFQTIGKAVATAQAGDTVIVRAGTYSESLSMQNSGTSAAYITFKAYTGEKPILDGGKSRSTAVNFNGKSYIKFQGFEVRNYTSNAFVISSSSSVGNIVQENHIHHNGKWVAGDLSSGVFIRYAKDTKVIKNLIHNLSGYGVRVYGDQGGTVISGNDVSYPGIDNIYFGSQRGLIENNYLHHNLTPVKPDEHADNIQIYIPGTNTNTGTIIRGNRLEQVKSNSMMLENSGGMLIYNNVVYGGNSGVNLKSCSNTKVFNNTFIDGRNQGIYVHKGSTNASSNVKVFNNIALSLKSSANLSVPDDGSRTGFQSGNNILSGDPKFVNKSGGNFHLASGSPAIDTGYKNTDGLFTYPSVDHDGYNRIVNGTIDIGAYEHGAGAPTTPPTGTTPTEPQPGDTVAPTVSFAAPANGATLTGPVYVKANASDGGGIAKVEFYLDGTLLKTEYYDPYEAGFDSTKVADGSHTIAAKAYDKAGNTSTATITVTVKNTTAGSGTPYNPVQKYSYEQYEPDNTEIVGVTDSSIAVRWNKPASGSPTQYKIYASDRTGNGTEAYVATVPASQTTYTHTGLERFTRKWYKVTAVYSDGESTFSDVAMGQTRTVRYQDDRAGLVRMVGTWSKVTEDDAASSGFIQSRTAGNYVELTFVGTDFALVNFGGPNAGIAKVYIDGKAITDGNALNGAGLDMYASGWQRQGIAYAKSGLNYAEHTVRIEVTGQKNPSSSSANVTFDAIDFYTR